MKSTGWAGQTSLAPVVNIVTSLFPRPEIEIVLVHTAVKLALSCLVVSVTQTNADGNYAIHHEPLAIPYLIHIVAFISPFYP